MGNNQQRSGQVLKEIRQRRSFNPNSSRKMKASSVSPNPYKSDNTMENQRIQQQSRLNINNSQSVSQSQRFGNASKMKDQQQYQQQQLKESQTSKLNKSNNIVRSTTPKEQRQGSNELVLNKYQLRNNQNDKSKNNSQQGLILSKYYDGNIIDEKAINDISISYLNQTQRNDLSMDSHQDNNKKSKGFASTAISQRLGMRRHSDNTLATAQQQIESSMKSRQGQENKWKKQAELMNTVEFMAEYRLFEGFFAGKEQTLVQTSFITMNMDLLEPFQEPSRGKGEMRQTFGPQQRDLDLQRYLQFLTDLESSSIEQMDYLQLTKEKKKNGLNFSSKFKGINNSQGYNVVNTTQTMNQYSSNSQIEQQKKEQQIQSYFLNENKSAQNSVLEKLDKDYQQFEQQNQQVFGQQNTNIIQEIPQKELVKEIGKNQQESQNNGLQNLRDLSELQKKLFEKSTQKLKEDQYSYDPKQTIETLGQDTNQQAATQEEWDHLCQELMEDNNVFDDKSLEEIIEEKKVMGSTGQIFSQKNLLDNQKNLLTNQQAQQVFSNVSSIVMNDGYQQENKKNDENQIQNIPRQLAQPIRGEVQQSSGRHLSEKSLVKEQTVMISEIEVGQDNTVFKKQDDERGMKIPNTKLYQQKSAEFPQVSQSQSDEDNIQPNSDVAAPFQNHFLPNFQYQNNNKTQPIQDPFLKSSQTNKNMNVQQTMPFRYLQKVEQSKQETAKQVERPLAGRKVIINDQVDDEILRKQMEIQQLDKRIGIVKETNEEAVRQRQERANQQLNKSRTGLTPNQSVIMNNTTYVDRTLPSPKSARNLNSQYPKGNVSPNNTSKYQGIYMNPNQYSNQHKKKRELQVDSYSQMLFPQNIPSESFVLSRTQLEQQQQQQLYQDTQYQQEMDRVMQMNNRNIQKEDEEQKNQNIQMYYNQKKELLKTIKNKQQQQQQYTPLNNQTNPQQNYHLEDRQIPLSARTYQDMVQQNNKLNQFNDYEDVQSNENDGFEESLHNINQQQQSQPIEVKMNLQDFRKNQKVKEEEIAAREVIPIEIDIKQFIKKRSSNANNDKNKIHISTNTGRNADNSRKGEIEEIGLKKLVLDKNNSESEGESILKSISRQVISLKGRIEKDQKVLDQNNISYQNKIVTKAINTLDNSFQNIAEDRHGSLQQIPDFNTYEHPHFLSHQPSKHNIQHQLQQQQQSQKQINQVSSTKDLKYQQIDSPSQFEYVPQGFGTVLENEDSQFSTIPSNYNPYLNTNNIPVTQFQLSKDQQNIQTFPTEEDDNKRYPMTSQFEVASLAGQQLDNQEEFHQKDDSQDSMHFFENQPAQFSNYQKQPFMDQNLQRTQQPLTKNTSKDVIASSTSSLHDGFRSYQNQLEQKGIRSVPSNNSLITSKRASIQSVQNQQQFLGGYNTTQNNPIVSNSPHMSTASRHSNQASILASKKSSIQGDDFKSKEQQYLNKLGSSNSEYNINPSRQQIGSSRQNQQSASSLQSNKYLKDNGNNGINSARSSENKNYFNQDFQFKQNGNINYEENDDNYSITNNQNRQSNLNTDGFDFSAFNSVEQNEDHYSASDVDSEDDNEPAKIKIDLNLFKKK